jgi:colicin import membrane protein
MELSRKERWQQLQSAFEPGFGRMLLISLLLHLLVPVLYYSHLFPHSSSVKPPVYRVNLVNKPVKNPQAGRPEAVPAKPKLQQKVAPKPEPAKPKPLPPKPVLPSKPAPKPEPAKPAPKAEPKPEAKSLVTKAQEKALQQRLEQLRAERERQAKLDALRAAVAAETQQLESPVKEAPVGMPEGKGKEAGPSAVAFVKEFIQQQWSLSKYQVSGSPQAEVLLYYSADGSLQHYRFLEKSGNEIFDDSLVRAITRSKQLPQPLPEEMEIQIIFNLKEMLDRP